MKGNIVILILKDQLSVFFVDSAPNRIVTAQSGIFVQKTLDDFKGFYDWLRDEDKNIIGLRYFLFEDYQYLVSKLSRNRYTMTESTKYSNQILYFYFSDKKEFVGDLSADQLFIDNFIYESETGDYGVSFNLPDDRDYSLLVNQFSHNETDILELT